MSAAPEVLSPSREAWRVFKRNKAAILGLVLLGLVIAAMLFGPALYPIDPFEIRGMPLTEPFVNADVPLGTDYLGRDILAGLAVGGRATLVVGLAAAAITVTIGLTIGALAGYFGGWIDEVLSRFTEIFQVLPSLLFAMVLTDPFLAFAARPSRSRSAPSAGPRSRAWRAPNSCAFASSSM